MFGGATSSGSFVAMFFMRNRQLPCGEQLPLPVSYQWNAWESGLQPWWSADAFAGSHLARIGVSSVQHRLEDEADSPTKA